MTSLEVLDRVIAVLDAARNVIAVCGATLDWEYLRHWTDQHGTSELLARLRREAAGA
jgi:hypothetical protein